MKTPILLISLSFLFISCNNSSDDTEKINNTDSVTAEKTIPETQEHISNENKKKEIDIAQKYPETYYYKNIEDKFNEIVCMFTDVCKIENECFYDASHSEFDNYKILEFILKRIDIVHNIKVKNKEAKDIFFLTFRFYSDKNKVDNALSEIKKVNKGAKIISLKTDKKENVNET